MNVPRRSGVDRLRGLPGDGLIEPDVASARRVERQPQPHSGCTRDEFFGDVGGAVGHDEHLERRCR